MTVILFFPNQKLLNPTLKTDHEASQALFTCNNCGAEFKRKFSLKKHSRNCGKNQKGFKPCTFDGCKRKFLHNSRLKEHVKRDHVSVNGHCENLPTPVDLSSDASLSVLENSSEVRVPVSGDGEHSSTTKSSFTCAVCHTPFRYLHGLKRHALRCSKTKTARRNCYVSGCNLAFYHETKLLAHLRRDHSINVVDHQMSFKSMADFLDWKEKEQESNFIYLSKRMGFKQIKELKHTSYVCQHDGVHRHCRKGGPKTSRMNKKGRARTGLTCPARLLVKENCATGLVTVRYIATHHHKFTFENTKFHPLSRSTKTFIQQQLSLGVPAKKIRDSLCEKVGLREQRKDNNELRKENFISLRTITEMARKLRLSTRLHRDDATSLMLTVRKLQSEEYDPVLIYKPHGGAVVVGTDDLMSLQNSEELFLLGIQTREQRDCLKAFATKIVCVDCTHCTNQYGYQLMNLVVQDEFGKGYPVAHFISSRMDEKVLHYFFAALKEKCPELVINAVMTDDDYAPWNAIVSVFGESPRHLLCTWHILRAWSRKLRSSTLDSNLYKKMFTALRMIMYSTTESLMLTLVKAFCSEYSSCAQSFVDYFKSNYCNRFEVWALCYRNFPHGNANTNMLVESFHNRLKTFYMNRIPNRRLDDLVNLLLHIEKDDYLRRKKGLLYKDCEDSNTFGIGSRHERGMKISDQDVLVHVYEDEDGASNSVFWTVKSQSKCSESYTVKLLTEFCSIDLCMESCVELCCSGLCAHMYLCSCRDKSGICKHIHKVHSGEMRRLGKCVTSSANDDSGVQLYDAPSGPIVHASVDLGKITEEVKLQLGKLNSLIEIDGVKNFLLPHISGVLKNLINQCEAIAGTQEQPIEMTKVSSVAPNEKLEKQNAPKRMNRLSRKKTGSSFLPKLSHEEKMDVLNTLNPTVDKQVNCDHEYAKLGEPCLLPKPNIDSNLSDNTTVNTNASAPLPTKQNQNIIPITNQKAKPNSVTVLSEANAITVPLLYNSENVHETLLVIHGRLGQNVRKTLSMLHLKSIEQSLPAGVESYLKLKNHDEHFVTGWVYDSVIDAFLLQLSKTQPHVLFADTCIALTLITGRPCNRLWENEDLREKTLVLFPANLTGNHWVLFAVETATQTILYLNPLNERPNRDETKLVNLIMSLLSERFFLPANRWKLTTPHHTRQKDSKNCGMFVMWYAYQLSHNKSIITQVDPVAFRSFIFNFLAGNCMKRNHFLNDSCRVCGMSNSNDRSISCVRCFQWYHCSCLGLSGSDNSAENFICP